jgi:hypothetical protein
VVEFHLKLKLILRIISYLTYICWEIDNFAFKMIFLGDFSFVRIFLKNYRVTVTTTQESRYFMFGKYNGFVSKARVSACMYFL